MCTRFVDIKNVLLLFVWLLMMMMMMMVLLVVVGLKFIDAKNIGQQRAPGKYNANSVIGKQQQ